MNPKFLLPSFGVVLIFTRHFCAARPHTHGHNQKEHVHNVFVSSSASSGSSLIVAATAATCSSINTSASLPVLASAFLDSSRFSEISNTRFLTTSAAPLPLKRKNLTEPQAVPTSSNQDGVGTSRSQSSASDVLSSSKLLSTKSSASVTNAVSSITGLETAVGTASSVGLGVYSYPALDVSTPLPTPVAKLRRATETSPCPAVNGSTYVSKESKTYQVICDVDYPDNDYPFLLVDSFDSCVQACDAFNAKAGSNQCIAALFVSSRLLDMDDCYLKYSIEHPTVATVGIEAAILMTSTQSSAFPLATPLSSSISTTSALSTPNSSGKSYVIAPSVSDPEITYASGQSLVIPEVAGSQLHGPAQNVPSQQYLEVKTLPLIDLAGSLLVAGVNGDLTTGYDISPDTGVLQVNSSTQSYLSPLKYTPHLSRDGGRGGHLNGQHLFLFCDTGSYTSTTLSENGDFLGFVSSSVAVDVGMNGLNGEALNIQDGIGQWSDDAGRMRGFAPLTEGEQSYNQVMQGNGQRYAIWPEASIIPLDAETGIVYAPIVYDNVNEDTKATVFTYTGTTLLSISISSEGGPVAERVVKKIFDENDLEWGCSGGIRSWGPSGIGGSDGKVYVFGNIKGGLLLGRSSPQDIADRDSYEYWDGDSWSSVVPTTSSKAFFISGVFMDVDVFYSPRHLTFIIVYLTIYADSTFYYRYLEPDQAIRPSYAPGGDQQDFVENILKYKWSEEKVLYKAAQGLNGKYIYAGGVHIGYYGSDDITNGGSKMLLSWTAPTGLDPSSLTSEYQLITAEIHWV